MVTRKVKQVTKRNAMDKKALVVVLGDLARSPRMQYHCISLAKHEYNVSVIATKSANDKACDKLEANENIHQHLFTDSINFKRYLPSLLAYLLKPIWQTLLLVIQLCLVPRPNVIILQNPPSVPTMPVMYLYSLLMRSKLIIDWHNYGFTILSLNLRPEHILVRLMRYIEIFFGQLADAGFCVSEAMRDDLRKNYHMTYPLHVLYDKPPNHFKPLSTRKKHEFFCKIKEQIPAFRSSTVDWYNRKNIPKEHSETRFTIIDRHPPYNVLTRSDRPAIILSSTSWTEDENFDLLLNALQHYEQALTNQYTMSQDNVITMCLPKLVCVITGKGPLKQYYENKIEELHLKHVEFVLPWLSAEDYALMVASCDVGISLHSSSSEVDLPMKVVDLFGCAIPVLAYRYSAINELVVEDFYGLTFKDSQDLFLQMTQLLKHFLCDCEYHTQTNQGNGLPDKIVSNDLDRFKKNITRHFLNSRWETNWKQTAKPVFDKLSESALGDKQKSK